MMIIIIFSYLSFIHSQISFSCSFLAKFFPSERKKALVGKSIYWLEMHIPILYAFLPGFLLGFGGAALRAGEKSQRKIQHISDLAA